MQRFGTRFFRFVMVGVTCLVLTNSAHADKVDRFVNQLATSKEYKVRLSAVLGLSKLGDNRGIPALGRALKDPDKTVRGVAAAGLGKLVDSSTPAPTRTRVVAALKRVMTTDKNSFVRSQAQKAYDALKDLQSNDAGGDLSIYVQVGAMATKTKSDEEIKEVMKRTAEKTLKSNASSMMLRWPSAKKPVKRDFVKKGVAAFYVDGTLGKLTVNKEGNSATIACEVNMLIATFPEKSMFGFLKGGAQVQGGASEKDITSGKNDCVAAVVDDLVRRKIIPAILTKAKQ